MNPKGDDITETPNRTMWKLTEHNATVTETFTRAYPALEGFRYTLDERHLAVTFPSGNRAAYFEITL